MIIKDLIENPTSDIQREFNEWFSAQKALGLKDVHIGLSSKTASLDNILTCFLQGINSTECKPFTEDF